LHFEKTHTAKTYTLAKKATKYSRPPSSEATVHRQP